jgi:hypothetical protein
LTSPRAILQCHNEFSPHPISLAFFVRVSVTACHHPVDDDAVCHNTTLSFDGQKTGRWHP